MKNVTAGNELDLAIADIQYFGEHKCPNCSAEAMVGPKGVTWQQGAVYTSPLLGRYNQYWGYAYFACLNTCYADPKQAPLTVRYAHMEYTNDGVRFARLGDALLPLEFINESQALKIHPKFMADVLNAQRVQQAIAFLNENAIAESLQEVDIVTRVVLRAYHGTITPAEAENALRELIDGK